MAQSDEYPVVVSLSGDGFRTEIDAAGFTLIADEPASVGGTDTGPGPYEYLLASLGACTVMTLRMYARRKGIQLDRAEIALKHERIHAKDCEDCETTEGMVSKIFTRVALHGDFTDAQRDRMLEIAEMCPVHRTLTGEVKIVTEPG